MKHLRKDLIPRLASDWIWITPFWDGIRGEHAAERPRQEAYIVSVSLVQVLALSDAGSAQSQNRYQSPIAVPRTPRAIEILENPTAPVTLENLQGDVYPTFPKKAEHFVFFTIADPSKFRTRLKSFIPYITTAAKVIATLGDLKAFKAASAKLPQRQLMPMELIQVAFSREGFPSIGIDGGVGEAHFDDQSQFEDAINLGDPPELSDTSIPDWEEKWRTTRVHGVFTVATESESHCRDVVDKIRSVFNGSINIINIVEGHVRPGAEEGHEHFGFLDGISEPAIRGIADPHKGQLQCDAGVVLMGHENDPNRASRPEWAKEGTIMVFRKLKQLVPEFNNFLAANPLRLPGLDEETAIELRGAKMVGRWKSGAPLDIAPSVDDKPLAQDPEKNNDFTYGALIPGTRPTQDRCPFAAHIRKTAPRMGAPLPRELTERSLIVRAGIPYGPEVTPEEGVSTTYDRGLLFVCYNSSLDPGFRFLQTAWANNKRFPPPFPGETRLVDPGIDPIIGNNVVEGGENDGSDGLSRVRIATGTNPENLDEELRMESDFVVARGGEYFFVPSISTLKRVAHGDSLVGFKAPLAGN